MSDRRDETGGKPVEQAGTLPGGIAPEQPPMDEAAGGPQADESDN